MTDGVGYRMTLGFLGMVLIVTAFAGTVETGDPLWIVLGGTVALGCFVAIPFLPYEPEEEAAVHMLTGDMADPRQRGPVVRSMAYAVPHCVALLVLGTGEADRVGLFGAATEVVLFVGFAVTGLLIVFESWLIARRDPYFNAVAETAITKTAAVFVPVTLTYQFGTEVFSWPSAPSLALYGGVMALLIVFVDAETRERRQA